MLMKKFALFLISSAIFAANAAGVDSTTAQKNGWANYAMQLGRVTQTVNSSCSTQITASYDKTTYKQFDPVRDRTQAVCQNGVNALASICKTPSGKAGAQKITSATCRYSAAGTSAAVEGEKLIINIDPAAPAIVGKKPGHNYNWVTAVREVL